MEISVIRNVIEPAIENLGFDIVRLKWTGGEYRKTLQLMIEPKEGGITRVEHCEAASHAVSAILDVEDVISDEYNLEVCSPGIDRPLTKVEHFERFKGFETKIEAREMINGRKRFRGFVRSAKDGIINFELKDNKEVVEIPFDNISEARLVLTDELINAGISN